MTKSFLTYCRLHQKAATGVGDFARDWIADKGRPIARAYDDVKRRLDQCRADRSAYPCARAAWRGYSRWRRRHR